MTTEQAAALIRKAHDRPHDLTFDEAISVNIAQAALAAEYVKLCDNQVPA